MKYQYLSVFNPNAGNYGPEINPYLDTFDAVSIFGTPQLSKLIFWTYEISLLQNSLDRKYNNFWGLSFENFNIEVILPNFVTY